MKKNFKKLIIFILLFSLGINAVLADTGQYIQKRVVIQDLKNRGLITYNWASEVNSTNMWISSMTPKANLSYWNFHSAKVGSNYYITYCLNAGYTSTPNDPVNIYYSIDNIKFNDGSLSQTEKNRRRELLKQLLLYGYNPVPTNDRSLDTLIANDPSSQLKLMAMQVLVWEVVEGSRTTFDTIQPQWNGSSGKISLYQAMIYPNGGNEPQKTNTLYYYYKEFLNSAKKSDQSIASPAFDENSYVLSWDSANKRYINNINGLGNYTTCQSDNSKVSVSVSGTTATIISSTEVKDVTITCKYIRGSGASNQSKDEEFRYFNFARNTQAGQDLIYGSGWKIYTKSFKVSSENTSLLIKKVDSNSSLISGAKFTLTHMTNQNYSVIIEGNSSSKNLNMSGKYRISETTIPKGYEKINDFNITINAKTHKITDCDNSSKDSNGNIISCLSNQVKVKYNGDTIELTIVNMTKNFKIYKRSSTGSDIKGATFEIRDSKNNLVKFSLDSGNVFRYNPEGTITSLSNSLLASYPISLLPEGEYKIVETSVPKPYILPSDEDSKTTLIKINSNRDLLVYDKNKKTYEAATSSIVKITNYITKFNVIKTGNGKPLQGVQFELYNSDKTQKISCSLDTNSPGNYTCSSDSTNSVYVTNSAGYLTFKSIPVGTYYLKEISTIEPFLLPKGDGVYTKVVINIDEKGLSVNGNYSIDTINISNSLNSFNFYKRDTEGNPLTSGKYKLQKYDKKLNKFVDLRLVEVENDGTYSDNVDIYKEDSKNGKIQFTLTKGVATFIEMDSSSTYRIIETVAPDGYTKASTKDAATVYIDEYGNASGLLVLVDQKIVKEDDSAFAELIINIQTGKERIMYAAIIAGIIVIISGLILYNKRK